MKISLFRHTQSHGIRFPAWQSKKCWKISFTSSLLNVSRKKPLENVRWGKNFCSLQIILIRVHTRNRRVIEAHDIKMEINWENYENIKYQNIDTSKICQLYQKFFYLFHRNDNADKWKIQSVDVLIYPTFALNLFIKYF